MTWSSKSWQYRGYEAEWDRIRKLVLARNLHLCQCPDSQGSVLRVRATREVHDIVTKAKVGTDESNLREVGPGGPKCPRPPDTGNRRLSHADNKSPVVIGNGN